MQFESAIIAAIKTSMKYVKQRMGMRSGNARYSADPGLGRLLGGVIDRTQNIQYGAVRPGRLGG